MWHFKINLICFIKLYLFAGKGESIWDTFSHQGGNVHNNDTGDDACKSYEKYKEDVKLLKDMGVGGI